MESRQWRPFPLKSGIVFAVSCFVLLLTVGIYSIQQSASSTAAVGYVFLPVVAGAFSVLAFAVGWLWGLLVPSSETASWRRTRQVVAVSIIFAFGIWAASELTTWWNVRKVVSQVHEMSAEELASLVGLSQNKFVLAAIAESPRATPDVLHRIVRMKRSDLYEPVGGFLPVPSINRKGIAVMRLVAIHPSTSPEDLTWLAQHSNDPSVLGDLARRSELDVDTLLRLAQRSDQVIDSGLASNTKAPADVLARLAASVDEYTRVKVAGNPATPKDALHILSTDHSAHVRARLATNPSLTEEILKVLSNDSDEHVRRLAAARQN